MERHERGLIVQQIYGPESAGLTSTAAEWHTRWLPAVLTRAREVLKPCYISHVDDSRVPPERHRAFDRSFDAFVHADISRRPRPDRGGA